MENFREVINICTSQATSHNCELNDFIIESLFMVSKSHMWHLQTQSYAQHKALNEFYDTLQDHTDKLAEAYIGEKGPLASSSKSFMFDDYQNCINSIQEYHDAAESLHGTCGDFPGLTNVLEDIITLCAGTLYKLKNLH